VISIISFLTGLYSDKKLCADECSYSKLIEDDIKKTLIKAKLILP